MFESIVATVLNQVLGSYVSNLEQNQLKLGIFSGNVVLRNLRLKKEAVDKLNLPIEVFEGYLGSLQLRIPWANLKTQPVRVLIGDLFVLAGPRTETEYDATLEEQRVQKAKQEMLETAELFRSSAAAKSAENDLANETFVNSLVAKIVDNLQIVIQNIHIRFEDQYANGEHPFALGLTLSNLSAVSTDANWTEAFLEDPKAPTHKLAKLDSLAAYWTPRSESLRGLGAEQFVERFAALIHSEKNDVEMRYLLKPVSGVGKIIMLKRPKAGDARNIVNLEFESIRLKMDDEQYYDVLMLAQSFILSSRSMQYRKHRPKREATPRSDPLVWFRYAATCVLEKIRARNKTRLWLTIMTRRQTRKKYVMLFKRREVDGVLADMDLAHFNALEALLSFDDIKFYRSLARMEMRTEHLIPFSLKKQQPKSFISRWWGGGDKDSDALIKEEDVRKFYETIDYDENMKQAAEGDSPDTKLVEVNFDLKSGSVSLAQTTPGAEQRKTILSLQFVGLMAHVIKRPASMRAEVSLLDFSVIENLTEHSVFPNLVRAKRSEDKLLVEADAVAAQDEGEEIERMARRARDPFLRFVLEQMPDNPSADQAITLVMKPLEIVLNHQAAHKIVEFVYGGRVQTALQSLASAAENRITQFANRTRANLEQALEQHKALDLSVDIDAPILFVPYDCEDADAFVFVADLGHIQVRSKLVTQTQRDEFARKRHSVLSEADLAALSSLMYDVLHVRLNKIKVSYAASMDEWQRINVDPEFLPEANRIVDDIDVSLSVGTCIVPAALNLAQTRIYGKIPSVQLILSDEKYKRMMELVSVLVPRAESGPEAEAQSERTHHPIFDVESTTHHSLSLSPLLEDEDAFYDVLDADPVSPGLTTTLPADEAHKMVKVDLLLDIDEVCAKLVREHRKYAKRDLLTFVAKRFRVAINVLPHNTVLNLLLEAFFIRDDLNAGLEDMEEVFILSGLGRMDDPSLLKVNVNLVDRAHPLFASDYNSAAIQVVVELAALNIFLHPNTLMQTAEFLDTMFATEEPAEMLTEEELTQLKTTRSMRLPSRTASRRSLQSSKSDGQMLRTTADAGVSAAKKDAEPAKILVTARLSELAVMLGIGSGHVADIVLSSAVAAVGLEHGDVAFNGKIADLVVQHKRRGDGGVFDFLRIDGDNMLDVTFNTFGAMDKTSSMYPGFDQLVKLASGALHFTYDALFVEDVCRFGVQFMEEAEVLLSRKRDAAQREKRARVELETIAEESTATATGEGDGPTSRLQFEVDVSSPVLDFPDPNDPRAMLSLHLGHMHASNSFVQSRDRDGNPLVSPMGQMVDQFIKARVDTMGLVLVMRDAVTGSHVAHKLLDDISLNATVTQMARANDRDYAATDVEGVVDTVRLKVGREQLQFLLALGQTLAKSVETATKPLERLKSGGPREDGADGAKRDVHIAVDEHNPMPTVVELDMSIRSVELVIYEQWETQPLARFALEGLTSHLLMQRDGSMMFEQYISSICANDLRTTVRRKFTEIIRPGTVDDAEDVKFKYERTADESQIIKVAVNAPQIVLSVDFVKAILAVVEGLGATETPNVSAAGKSPLMVSEVPGASKRPRSRLSLLNDGVDVLDAQISFDEHDPALADEKDSALVDEKDSALADEKDSALVDGKDSALADEKDSALVDGKDSALVDEKDSLLAATEHDSSLTAASSEEKRTFILAEVVGMNLFVLEDPDSVSSEAMQLSIGRITFAQQTNMSISVDGVSAGFVNMDNAGSVVQFIDSFDVSATVELSKTASEQITQVWAIVKPIVVRFSYQDIQFFSHLSSQFSTGAAGDVDAAGAADLDGVNQTQSAAQPGAQSPAQSTADSLTASIAQSPALSGKSAAPSPRIAAAVMRIVERVQVNLEGIRVMFIDDFASVHVPLLDISVDKIAAEVRDWSSNLRVSGILKLHVNFFNRLNSHWEPVIEPWALDLSFVSQKGAGAGDRAVSNIVLSSERALELIASHAFLETMLSVSGKMAKVTPRAASAYREVAKPYLIRNYTGHRVSVWAEDKMGEDGALEVVEISPNEALPYEFEDWRTMRKSTKSRAYRISLHLMESPWESVKNIAVDQGGLFVYALRPKVNSVSHKLVCEVELVEGVRHVILRAATCFRNNTKVDVEIQDVAAETFAERVVVAAGGIASLPISFSAGGAFRIRPCGVDYQWSEERLNLHELLDPSRKKRVLQRAQCASEHADCTPFFFSVHGLSDTPEEVIYATASLAARATTRRDKIRFYGLGTIAFSPPLELENLLPYDFKYRIYDRDGKYDFGGELRQGAVSALHGVDVSHVIGLSLEIDDQQLKTTEVAVINNGASRSCDERLIMADAQGIETSVCIDVDTTSTPFGVRTVRIYSPYVIINQTGLALEFKSSTALIGADQVAAGQSTDASWKPLLFSYPESNLVSGRDRIKVKAVKGASTEESSAESPAADENTQSVSLNLPLVHQQTEWSKPLSLDAVGNVTNFNLTEGKQWFNLALYVHLGSDRFAKVHIVKFAPRFMLANRIAGRTIHLQAGDEPVVQLAEGTVPFHCNPSHMKQVRLSYDGRRWTPVFAIGDVADTYLKLPANAHDQHNQRDTAVDEEMDLVKVSGVLETMVMYVAVSREKNWPFRLVNRSSVELKYRQKGCGAERILLPGEAECFAWDDPSAGTLLLSVTVLTRTCDVDIRELGPCKPVSYRNRQGDRAFLGMKVVAEGPVLVVKFRDFDPRSSRGIFTFLPGRKADAGDDDASIADDASERDFGVREVKDEEEMTLSVRLAAIGISLVGSDLVEFLYVSGRDLEVRLQQSRLFQTFGVKLKWLQIDNQLLDYTHPILLYPAVVQKTAADLEAHPTVNVGIIRSRDQSHGVDYYKYFGVLLQELNVELGEELLRKVLLFAQFESIVPAPMPLLNEVDMAIPVLRPEAVDTRLMYFDLFQIHPIKLNITFSLVEAAADGAGTHTGVSAYNPLRPLLSVLSMASGNISDAPLTFNSLLIEHPIVDAGTLQSRVMGHYAQQAIVQVHKILGSIDMLGNPVGLFNTMGSGVTDLFYEPYQGFVSDRPQDIGIGLAKGGFSFMRKTVSGLTGTFSKLTGSLGKGLAAATMDNSFQRSRRTTQARNRPVNAAAGVTTGARSFYQGVASGLSGIVGKPMEGARTAGVGGFFRGVGVGLLGAVTKPLVGALDLTTSISEGVKNTAAGEDDEVSQMRWPRVIPHDAIVTAYSAREAYGQSLLATAIGLSLFYEKYFAHLEVPEDECIAFVTTARILYVKRRTLQINWQVSFAELLFCRPNFDSVLLSVRQGEIRKRLIFCQDQASQEWFCIKVDEGLALYNDKHRAVE